MNEFTPEQKEKYKDFTEDQMNEIKNGFENGLSEEQVDVYAKPEFNESQMRKIRMGFESGFSMEQVSVYAKPEFNSDQMGVLKDGLERGLSIEQVSSYANPKFNDFQMYRIGEGYGAGLSAEQVNVYAKPEFNSVQMKLIEDGFRNKLSMEQVKAYAKPEFDLNQMWEIENGLDECKLSIEQVGTYAKPEFNSKQMEVLKDALRSGLSIEQVIMCAKPELDSVQMWEIRDGLEYGLSMEQIAVYAKPEFNTGQMNVIISGFINNLSMEQVNLYAKPEIDNHRMEVIKKGLQRGLSMEQINPYINPEFSDVQVEEIGIALNRDYSIEKINMFAKPELSEDLIHEIKDGFEEGFSAEQVSMYAKPEFDYFQKEEIKNGLKNGLSMEQISVYAKPEFSANQIYAAMNGLRNGISTDKINDIINSGMSPEEMSNAMFNEVKKDSTGVIVYRTAHKVFENYYSKTDAFICRTETEAIDLIKEKQLNDYQNQQNYSYSYKVVGKNGDLSKAIREDQRVILAPSYDMAKNINAEATVEAEYGDECLEGTMVTLAHHGPRSGNPAPCNTSDVPKLPPFATVVVSHIDLDTLGGIYALQGRKPEDDRFWEAAEMIDVKGVHHIHELDKDIQDKLNAYYAYNYNHAGERYSETADVTKQVEDAYGVINDILDIDAPEHDMLIADGKEWAQAREAAVEAQLIYEDKNMRVFDSNGVFCAASYYSPKQDALIPATVTYNEKTKTITLGFEDGGKQYNAMEIVRSVWGPEAGGREGIAGSPRGIEMTKDDLHALVERLKEVQASAGVEKNIQNEKDASKKARHSRKKTASSEEEIEL